MVFHHLRCRGWDAVPHGRRPLQGGGAVHRGSSAANHLLRSEPRVQGGPKVAESLVHLMFCTFVYGPMAMCFWCFQADFLKILQANLDKFGTFFMAIPGHSDFFLVGVGCDGNFYITTRNSTCSSGDRGADQFSFFGGGVVWGCTGMVWVCIRMFVCCIAYESLWITISVCCFADVPVFVPAVQQGWQKKSPMQCSEVWMNSDEFRLLVTPFDT